jgi:hypothetical protein
MHGMEHMNKGLRVVDVVASLIVCRVLFHALIRPRGVDAV